MKFILPRLLRHYIPRNDKNKIMKVSINWLKELIDLKVPIEELVRLFPLRTIGLKEITDSYLELDMKGYNRADLLSLRGVASEVAAITDSKVTFEDSKPTFPDLNKVNVEITDENLCPVYLVAKIENLKVENSNETWVKKLNDSGIRTVNNIADITNLVMVEYGQPLHAFDADTIENETIIVRPAKEGDKLVTLDGKERNLSTEDLLITDPQKAIGLAGVMGGKNTEVTNSTSTILLEAAIFDPKNLRKTATKLGLISEASKRFYHGLTKKRLLQAFNAAIKMYESLGGKVTAITLAGNLKDEPKTIKISQQKVNSLIGVEVSPKQIEDSLQKLGFKTASHSSSGNVNWEVTVPYWRLDVNIEEDVIEEIARMYGYEKIPATPLTDNIPTHPQKPIFGLIGRLKKALVSLGLTETQTYSYYSTSIIENCKLKTENLIHLANPISAETEYLRENSWPNLVEVVGKNIRQGFDDVAIFEIGKIYYRNEKEEASEKYSFSIALTNNTDNPLAELYEIFKKLNKALDLQIKEVPSDAKLEVFHPTRFIQLGYGGKMIGGLAEVHKRVTDKLGINQRVAILEIGITKLT